MNDRNENFSTNMGRMHGWTLGTVRHLAYTLTNGSTTPELAASELKNLERILDLVWENKSDRIVEFSEYIDSSK